MEDSIKAFWLFWDTEPIIYRRATLAWHLLSGRNPHKTAVHVCELTGGGSDGYPVHRLQRALTGFDILYDRLENDDVGPADGDAQCLLIEVLPEVQDEIERAEERVAERQG